MRIRGRKSYVGSITIIFIEISKNIWYKLTLEISLNNTKEINSLLINLKSSPILTKISIWKSY